MPTKNAEAMTAATLNNGLDLPLFEGDVGSKSSKAPKGLLAFQDSSLSMTHLDLNSLENDPNSLFSQTLTKANRISLQCAKATQQNLSLTDFENNPKGFIAEITGIIADFFSSLKNKVVGKPPVVETTPPVDLSKANTKTWLEDEIAILRAMIESDTLHIDNFVHKLTQLAGLSFFQSGQVELEEIKTLYEGLKKMLEEQKAHYNNNKVFVTDILNGVFAVIGGGAGLAAPHIATATQTISQGGQSASKIFGNSVERDKTHIQHLIEQIKQKIEQARAHRSATEQQTSKMDDHRSGANQMRGQIVGQINS